MKKGIITMIALMLGMASVTAQNKLIVSGSGDVTIRQGEQTVVNDGPVTRHEDQITAHSYQDVNLTLQELRSLTVSGAGDLEGIGTFKGAYLSISSTGTGDINLTIDYDTVTAIVTGVGDVNLDGRCHYLKATVMGLGDLNVNGLKADSVAVLRTRNGESQWEWKWDNNGNSGSKGSSGSNNKSSKSHKSLLLRPHWMGVDAGLNLMLGPGANGEFEGNYVLLELRPLNSWNFNFNIADIGLAFTRSHAVGIYTGVGLGWNNYSFSYPVRLGKDGDKLVCNAVDELAEGPVRRSKLGVLYLQSPLMLEVRPTKKSYIALGVTGGIRIDTWTKVKFQAGKKEKIHSDYFVNRFKLDASLRAGGNHLGFFANYNLLPLFQENKAPEAHTLSFGLSLNF